MGNSPARLHPRDFVRSVSFIEDFTGDSITNVTTPRDMATFFRLLRDDKLVSPLASWRIKHVLDERVITDRLPALLPESATVVHKTGNLDGVLHDVGFIETPSGPVIVIAMAQAATDIEQTVEIEQQLGLAAYQTGISNGPDSVKRTTPVARSILDSGASSDGARRL